MSTAPMTPGNLLGYATRAVEMLTQLGLKATRLHISTDLLAEPFIQVVVPLADLVGAPGLAGRTATRSPSYAGGWAWTVVVDGVRIVAEEPAAPEARKTETLVLGASNPS